MTVRHFTRRVWLAAFISGSVALAAFAQSPEPGALPPLPGATPVVPPPSSEGLPPLPSAVPTPPPAAPPLIPAGGTTPTVPPPTEAAPAVPSVPPPVAPPAAPIVPPPAAPAVPAATPSVPATPAAPSTPATPATPAPLPMMSPMPTAAPSLPPMNPMAPATPPAVEPTPAKSEPKAEPPAVTTTSATLKPATEVKIGKPAVEGLAAYSMALSEAKIAFGKVTDYSGHVVHQDRVKGKLTPEQTAEIRVKAKPASVSLRYVGPSAMLGQEMIHVAGRNAGKLRMKPAGTFGTGGFLTADLTDSRAMAHTRHPVTEFGIGPMLDRLERQLVVEQRLRNAVQVSVAEYAYAGKKVSRFEVFTDRAHALRTAYRTVVYVDKETKLPIRIEAYDQPTAAGSPTGDLLESYSYVNLKFNQGIGDAIFEK